MHPSFTQAMNSATSTPVRVVVDLSELLPGGENGGIKPFVFETLRWLGRQRCVPLQFLYLTRSRTHAEVRDELARVNDELICVRADGGPLPRGDEHAPRERLAIPPPMDFLSRLGARVLYCPFGAVDFAAPDVCTICTVVDVLHRDFPGSLGEGRRIEREHAFQRMLAVADALQCNSEYVISRLREHYGVASERMFTVYNAVHQRFAYHRAMEKRTSPSPDHPLGAPFFFYPANSWKHKNHETLLLAYNLYRAGAVAAGAVPWPLALTGYEDDRWAELRSLAHALGLLGEDAVRFLGYVPTQEFGRLWSTAGALVFPSLHEGFGIPLLEAMQHDVPILCSREGSLPEVGADACLFVDARSPESLAKGMTRLATDASLRQRLIEAGRRRRSDFSQDDEAGALLDVIVSLARTRPPYRPYTNGIFADGWTERTAVLALPAAPSARSMPGRLTLRFDPMPEPRRLRLRVGACVALGSFELRPHQADKEISIDFWPDGSPLWIEVPNASSLSADDPRIHGVRLHTIDLRLSDGQEYPLFAAR